MNTVRTTRIATLATLVAAMAGVTGCATGPDRQAGDPLEPMNRAVFSLNDKLDNHVAKPVAVGYTKVTPAPLRTAIGNVFSNIGDIGNFANNLLQLNVTDATEDLMRFSFNSTFGLGGLIDWASAAGLPKHHEDFGLTLGHYGVPAGAYLVLPLFGPSSIRDASGFGNPGRRRCWIVSHIPTMPLGKATTIRTMTPPSTSLDRSVLLTSQILSAL